MDLIQTYPEECPCSLDKTLCKDYDFCPLEVHEKVVKALLNPTGRDGCKSTMVQCHTCGSACTIGGDDKEGTHYFIPIVPYQSNSRDD